MSAKPHTFKPFIPAALDDAGLTLSQFRVLLHVVRRGVCFARVATIASACRCHPKTVRRALHRLEKMGWIMTETRTGKTSVHQPGPKAFEAWNDPALGVTNSTATGGRIAPARIGKKHEAQPAKGTKVLYPESAWKKAEARCL